MPGIQGQARGYGEKYKGLSSADAELPAVRDVNLHKNPRADLCSEGEAMSNLNPGEAFGCIFCRTGSEAQLARSLEREHASIRVLSAAKVRMRRQGKMLEEEQVSLFPGYLFFRAAEDFEIRPLAYREDVFRVLHDARGDWRLKGEDESFASALFEQNGVIGLSKAYYEGDRIRIVDGMLKKYEGRILRVNRRSHTAQVCVGVAGQEVTVWLGFELIDKD